VIESFGSTKLVQVGSNFYLNSNSSGTGPELKYVGSAVVAGQFGNIAPIAAEQTTNGYNVAWKVGADQYTAWSTDSNGNYLSNFFGAVSGSNPAFRALETTFHQDLNGDGVIGIPAPVASAATAGGPDSTLETFTGSSLTLDASSLSHCQIIGFAGDGTLQGSDQIDLRGMNYHSVHSDYDSSTGILAISDGTNTTDIQFLGNYSQDSFKFADDGAGGSVVYARPAAPNQIVATNVLASGHETFVFGPNFGQISLAHFVPETDTIQINRAVFASIDALLAATHDDSSGNAVITDAVQDTITLQNVTTAQLHEHQSDFHLV
jgi:hypothetical protein